MGFVKNRMTELYSRGFGELPDKYVCADCFENSGIKKFIKKNSTEYMCSYCGRDDSSIKIAAPIESVVGLIMSTVGRLFEEPVHSLPYDNESGYFGVIKEFEDVLSDIGLEVDNSKSSADELWSDIVDSVNSDQWTPLWEGLLERSKSYETGWHNFVEQVKNNSRYIFSDIKYEKSSYYEPDTPTPSKMLPEILKFILKAGLIERINKEKIIFRIRIIDINEKGYRDNASCLGTPKANFARYSNRMSPAGIPMFYGSFDADTAMSEVLDKSKLMEGKKIKIAKFKLLRDIYVVNFTKDNEYCLFDKDRSEEDINAKIFLNFFTKELSQPVKKDGREHINYVPTQIVTEYIKYKCCINKKRVKGLVFNSSKREGISCVFFLRNKNCVDKGVLSEDGYLELIDVETIEK